ncbi:MAG: hypothetical protein V5A45_11945 [Haloarculaceae archaeon]
MTDDSPLGEPARLSSGLSIGAAGVAAVAGFGGSGTLLVLTPLGVVVLATGLLRRSRRLLTLGCVLLVAGIVTAGLAGAGPARLVTALAATVVAWDLAEFSIGLGEQLGREAETWRVELLHAGVSILVATAALGVVLGVFVVAEGGQPLAALLFLLVGVMALLATLRER